MDDMGNNQMGEVSHSGAIAMSKTDSLTIEVVRSLARRKKASRDAEVERQAKRLVDRVFHQLAKSNFEVENENVLRVTVWTMADGDVKARAARLLEGYGFQYVELFYGHDYEEGFGPIIRQTFRLMMPPKETK